MLAKSCRELLEIHKRETPAAGCRRLDLRTAEEGLDVYNITAPFFWNGKRWLLGRAEPRSSEFSQVLCFQQDGESWTQCRAFAPLTLQDPFFAFLPEGIVVGGVEVFYRRENDTALSWRTAFYKGKSLFSLQRFAQGPEMMKDIRLHALPDGKILAFTRPNGKIGCCVLDSLDQLGPDVLADAPLLEDHFTAGEWGGVNEIHLLQNGLIGALSHAACFDNAGNRHYYACAFAFDPARRRCTPMRMIACRDDFLPGPAKRPDLQDVVFSGGLVRRGDGTAELYCGVSDAGAQARIIPDPFLAAESGNAAF